MEKKKTKKDYLDDIVKNILTIPIAPDNIETLTEDTIQGFYSAFVDKNNKINEAIKNYNEFKNFPTHEDLNQIEIIKSNLEKRFSFRANKILRVFDQLGDTKNYDYLQHLICSTLDKLYKISSKSNNEILNNEDKNKSFNSCKTLKDPFQINNRKESNNIITHMSRTKLLRNEGEFLKNSNSNNVVGKQRYKEYNKKIIILNSNLTLPDPEVNGSKVLELKQKNENLSDKRSSNSLRLSNVALGDKRSSNSLRVSNVTSRTSNTNKSFFSNLFDNIGNF